MIIASNLRRSQTMPAMPNAKVRGTEAMIRSPPRAPSGSPQPGFIKIKATIVAKAIAKNVAAIFPKRIFKPLQKPQAKNMLGTAPCFLLLCQIPGTTYGASHDCPVNGVFSICYSLEHNNLPMKMSVTHLNRSGVAPVCSHGAFSSPPFTG